MLDTFPNYPLLSIEEQQIWTRIKEFNLAAIVTSLMQENSWSLEFTDRVILEFKKYVFLSVVSHKRLSPSQLVDLVWHKFLLHTRLYWEDFCSYTLEQPFHHYPNQGGEDNLGQYQQMYCNTLTCYLEIFGERPSPEIWEVNVDSENCQSAPTCGSPQNMKIDRITFQIDLN
jgi:hypothetical protein